MQQDLLKVKQSCIDFIANYQDNNGEFKTNLYFPGKPENGWIYAGASVFITSCIAINLMGINDKKADSIRNKAANYVKSQMEQGGLWRFYPHNGLFKFNTPLDIDDTSLASYLLANEKIPFPDNRPFIYKQLVNKRNFNIWFLPRIKFLTTAPMYWLRLALDLKYSWPIFFPLKGRTTAPLIAFSDTEHAVNANVILYLGKTNQTQTAINHLIEDLLFGNKHNLFFYPGYLFTYYHISRLYETGIGDFENTKQHVENYMLNNNQVVNESVFNKAIALLTLSNYKSKLPLKDRLAADIAEANEADIFSNYGYFCTKDRNMVGGSEALTASIVVKAISEYLKNKSDGAK